MTHQRKTIRSAVRSAVDGATAADDRVFPTRVDPYRLKTLPAIGIYGLEESVDDDSAETYPRELTRRLSLVIEGWVAVGATPEPSDDLLDDLAEQIEAAMDADRFFGGAAADSILTDTTMERHTIGDRDMAMVALVYRITYRTDALLVPTLDDFETVEATYNLGNEVDPGDEAVDDFVVEETP